MELMSISNLNDELTSIETYGVTSSCSKDFLLELQEKIQLLGDLINSVQKANNLTALAKQVMPNVVCIETRGGFQTIKGSFNEGYGSGCVISPEGYIVTNHHVIDGAEKIQILFHHSGLNYVATLIGSDPETDIALLKIDADDELSYSHFGDSDKVEIGSRAVLVGNPLGFQNLLTTGVIGGKSPTLASAGKNHSYDPWEEGIYADYIFSDTLGNPGNSGGPLFNLHGDVIGIIARGAAGPGGGVAMSIASNTVAKVIAELKDKGYVTRASLGAEIVSAKSQLAPYLFSLLSEETVAFFDENCVDFLFVADILKDSAAIHAGLRRGDLILSYDDILVSTPERLFAYLAMNTEPEYPLKLSILRDGEIIDFTVILGKREVNHFTNIESLGICVENMEGEKYFTFQYDSSIEGVFVHSVENFSDAFFMGLRPADVITGVIINGQSEISVKKVEELEEIIHQMDEDHQCVLVVRSFDRSRPSYIHIDLY
jgi:serine protease Do